MAVIRNNDYVVFNKSFLNDTNLSLQEKGLLSMMLSQPDDFVCSFSTICVMCNDDKTTIEKTLLDLFSHGYIEMERQNGEITFTIHEKTMLGGNVNE